MFYTIYKVTNLINGKIYIGKHQTKNPNDAYYGSGKAVQNAIKLHGKHNFYKEVLHIFEREDEMNAKERELITEEFVARSDTYNLGVGGEGGPHFRGRTFTDEQKKKISLSCMGRKVSEETRNKIAEASKKRIITDEIRKNISLGRKGKGLGRKSTISTKSGTGIPPHEEIKEKYIMTAQHKANIAMKIKSLGIVNYNSIEKVICPHCLKEGQKLAMARHHFTNCKLLREGQDG